jgi:mono/diheme cytochrome c family protein
MSLRAVLLSLTTIVVVLTLTACAGRHRVHGAVASPNVPGADLGRGKAVYLQQCAACHGIAGMGGEIGPSLSNERARRTYEAVRKIVTDPPPPMPKLYPSRITQTDVRDVSAYVETL